MNQNETRIANLLATNVYDHSAEPPLEQVVFRIQFKVIGSLGDFILFSGRPKAGKSKYISGCIAAALSRQDVFDMRIKLPDHKKGVVHFDTEQSKYSHYKMMQLILQLSDTKDFPDHFKSYRCRSVSPSNILAMVEYYLKSNLNTGIVYLDGLLDTVDSMNDEKHSNHLKNWLKRITEEYNILLAGVIHRGFTNDKSIGQVGSAGERAAQTVLIVEKNKETKQYLLKAEYMRDDDEFSPVAICYNTQLQLWQQTEYNEDTPAQTNRADLRRKPQDYEAGEHRQHLAQIFNILPIYKYNDLLQLIKEVYGVGRPWAVECVKYLCSENLLWRTDEGLTNIQQAKLIKAN